MPAKFSNNASAPLAASINSTSTSITVTTGYGALFPGLGAGEYFYATLTNSSNDIEIVKVTARSTDTLTATRGQEGTTALSWAAADKIELRITAADLTNFAQLDGTSTFTGANTFSGASTLSGAVTLSGSVTGTALSTYLAAPPSIGSTTAAAGSFTTLSASGAVSGTGFINYLASPPAIGTTTPAAGSFTTLSVSSYGNIKALLETATITASSPSAITNFDVVTQAVQYYTTNNTNNFTLNVRGNSTTTLTSILAIGQSVTISLMVTNGTTAYYPTAFQIDGATLTPKWQSGYAPTAGNASSIDMYTYAIVKTAASTYTVLASQTRYA